MSLAQYQVPTGAISSASAWNPGMEQPSMSQPSGFSGSSSTGLGVVGPAQTSDSRGELTGDTCLSLDIFVNSDEVVSSQWSEGTCECTSAVHSSSKALSYTAEGRTSLLNSELTTKDLYNDEHIGVGKAISSSISCDCPLQYLCDAECVETSLEIDVGQGERLHISRLLSQFLVHGLQLHQDLKSSADEVDKPKKVKGSKKGRKGKQAAATLVCPVGFNQIQRAALVAAADQAEIAIKNVFNRAVAVVAGGLYAASRVKESDTILGALREKKQDPTVLYLNVYNLAGGDSTGAKTFYEAALVRCEGGEGAQKVGSRLGFERLNTLATRGGVLPVAPDGTVADHLKTVVTALLASKELNSSNVSAVIFDGLLARGQKQGQKQGQTQGGRLKEVSVEALGLTPTVYAHRANVVDAAQGACILSAAELESSKQYLQMYDGAWKIAYLLPVADGVLEGRAVAVRVQWDQAQADAQAALDNAQEGAADGGKQQAPAGAAAVFEVDARIWKEDAGPIPPRSVDQQHLAKTYYQQDFKWKASVKVDDGARTVTAAVGWPRVQVLQRCAKGADWQVLKTLTPLLTVAATEDQFGGKENSGGKQKQKADPGEPVESCGLSVRLDPATGGVCATQIKGKTISAARSEFWGRLQLAFVLVLPFALIALWYYSGFITKWYVTRQHTAWLLDFYQKNAPEKLKDPQYVARTISKYEGRMFQLWRGLERTYKVKWQPPQSILDSSSSSLLSDEF
eukprot:gene18831-21426_t